MSSLGSSRSIPFRSKKRLMESPCSKSEPNNTKSASIDIPTPEKPQEIMLTRSRNRGVALSVKEIRQANSRRRSEELTAKNKLVFSSRDSSSSPSKRKSAWISAKEEKLSEKYENLIQFFDALDNAIRLSKLKGSMLPTFSNIAAKVEYITERRFSCSHLAQLKHILPEAIEIKRVMVFDEKTSCMKPDLHVTLNIEAMKQAEKSKSDSKNISLRRVFRARLAAFDKAHPQDDEVPEEPLPEPFNRNKQSDSPDMNYRLFQSKKIVSSSSFSQENSSIYLSSEEKPRSHTLELKQSSSYLTRTSLGVCSLKEETALTSAKPTSSQVRVTLTPVKLVPAPVKVVSTPAKAASTPVKEASTPPELASTPARLFSARSDHSSAGPPKKLIRRSSAIRSLKYDPRAEDLKAKEVEEEDTSSDDDDIMSILPESLLQSIKEQETNAIEDQDPAISQAKKRHKVIACLPKLFNFIHFLFQSIRRSVITKQELIHKIISGHSDIVDRREVEEQLNLMIELVPEWISEQKSHCGDLLICINKMTSPETTRRLLEEETMQAMPPASTG